MSRLSKIKLGNLTFSFRRILFNESIKVIYMHSNAIKIWERHYKSFEDFNICKLTYTKVTAPVLYEFIKNNYEQTR